MLRELRKRLGLTLDEMADRLPYSLSMISRWEAGTSNIPSERLPELAQAYECRLSEIFADDDTPYLPSGPTLQVVGAVAAGVWKEVWQFDEDERVSYTGRSDVNASMRDRFGLRVDGESMNDVYPHGTIIDCVSLMAGAELKNGKRVVVQRQRVDGEFEVTVKEYRVEPDGSEWLLPRSSRPEFQRPMRLGEPEPGIVEVRIIAVVVASIRPE